MRLAILGTRGIPASYGGFETFAEELSWRLVERGHEVTVYCRSHYTSRRLGSHRGVRLVVLPTIRHKYLDTVTHTFVSAVHGLVRRYDAALVCNAANSIFVPLLKLSGTPVAINVDGLEWQRKKWNRLGRSFYRVSERLAGRVADEIVCDARTIETHYRETYGRSSVFIPYGAPTEKETSTETLRKYGLEPGSYILYVSRFEPENNAHRVIEAFQKLEQPPFPLVMVGDAPYAREYVERLKAMAGPNVVFTGYVFGRGYRELQSHAYSYVQATEVGGTHPALVESMGLGNGVLVNDTPENREVAGDGALFFSAAGTEDLAEKLASALAHPETMKSLAERARQRVRELYSWDRVVDAYENLFRDLANGDKLARRDSQAHVS
ncbi:MAG: glycosyltransferase [Acidobacteriota bacterium]|nr:MAG: glycosyltransferase [Acidobacteriota bacterium]